MKYLTEYLTEIYEKPAKNHEHAYTNADYEEIQKNRMLGQLYDQVDEYYRNLIRTQKALMAFSYIELNGEEYAHVGIYDMETGEQIL